jgi:hypothetical protein
MTHPSPPLAPRRATRAATCLAASLLMLSGILPAADPKPALDQRPHAVAFRQLRHGIFIHNVYGLTGWPDDRKTATLDEFANAFDVKIFADQMAGMGVEYVYFTAWHKAIYLLAPNKALEKWLPGHSSKRDLVGEIADALHAKKIKLVIYAHPNDGHDLTPAEQAKIGYSNRAEDKGTTLNKFTNEVYAELAERYGKKPNVLGFWWDSWWQNGGPVNMPRLRATVLKNFPGAITLSNKQDPQFIDFLSIEGGGPPQFEQMTAFKDNLTFFTLGDWWSANRNSSWYHGRPLSPEAMYRFLLLNVGTGAPGGMCWAMSPLADGKTWPGDNQPLTVLQALGKHLAPVRPTICNILPSRNWLLPPNTTWPKAPAFVAARSPSNKSEFIHVIKPPAERFIDLPKPVESFSGARMYLSKKPVAISPQGDGLRLTLPDGESWSELDTVIELAIKPSQAHPAQSP